MSLTTAVQSTRRALFIRQEALHNRLTMHYAASYVRLSAELDGVIAQTQSLAKSGAGITQSLLVKRTRLEALLKEVGEEAVSLGVYASEQIRQESQLAIGMALDHTQELIQAGSGLPPSVEVPPAFLESNSRAIYEQVGRLSHGSPLRAALNALAPAAVESVERTLIQGLVAGKNPLVVARELKDTLSIPLHRAQTIARTEMLSSYRQASQQRFHQSKAVQGWRWLCARNRRTCAMCLAMDGREFSTDKGQYTHPNCRCTMVPITLTPAQMGINLPDRRPKLEPAEEWFKRQSREDQALILGKRKLERLESGKLELADVIGYGEDKAWGPFRWERSLVQIDGGVGVPPKETLGRGLLHAAEKPSLPVYASIGQAEEALRSTFVNANVDLTGMDVRAANAITSQLLKLAQDYPVVNGEVEAFVMGKLQSGVIAEGHGLYLTFSEDLFTDLDKVNRLLSSQAESGFLLAEETSVEALITHEYGHFLHFPTYVQTEDGADIDTLVRKFMKENPSPKGISRYALQDEREAWAEGFASIYFTPEERQAEYVKKQQAFLTSLRPSTWTRYKYVEGEKVIIPLNATN